MSKLRILICLLFASWAAALHAAVPIQDMQILRQLGNAWLEQQAAHTWPDIRAQARTNAVDDRLRLAACDEFRFSLPAGARLGNSGSIKAQCVAPIRWSLYLGFRIRLSGPALVARRDLPARATLDADDVEMRVIDYEQPPAAYLSDIQPALGARIDWRIPAGQPVPHKALSRPPSISAGQRVRIVVRGAGFNVNQDGNALNTAATGEPVRVRIRSGRIVHGIAQDDGSVLVRP